MEPLDPEVPHVHENGEVHSHEAEGNGQYALPDPTQTMEAVTAFLVVIHKDGTATGIGDINTPVKVERGATLNDMYSAAAQVCKDVAIMQQAQMTANAVLQGQMQLAAQAKEAAFAQKLVEKGMRIPGR